MANSILPDTTTAGGIVYRDAAGNPLDPPDVFNAYSPAAAFTSSCLLTALPSTCDARIEPKQINAIVSELISFAECMNPDGVWNCDSLKNLCAAFTAFTSVIRAVTVSDDPPADPHSNELWWESDTGYLYINYDDGTSTQWVQIVSKVYADQFSIVGSGYSGDPFTVGTVDCGTY